MALVNETASWIMLRLQAPAELPPLYYSYQLINGGFTLNVTDFITLWQCFVEGEQLVAEAHAQNSSIDPSESPSQARTLCDKLREALQDGQNVLVQPNNQARDVALVLQTVKVLPKPLNPLRWAFNLIQADSASFSNQVTKPCLSEIVAANHKLDSLLQIIRDKDHVISRLLDKIEGSAIDLSLIIPGITGLKSRKSHVGVVEAKKHVSGMSTFDQTAWNIQISETVANKHKVMPFSGTCNDNILIEDIKYGTTSDWVQKLGTRSTVERDIPSSATPEKKQSRQPFRQQVQKTPSVTNSDSDFETQKTLPSGTKLRSQPSPKTKTDESTTSSDLDQLHSPPKGEHRPVSLTKLGKISGRDRRPSQDSQSSASGHSLKQKRRADPDTSDSESSDEKPRPKKPKAKLGTLGRKSKEVQKPPTSTSPSPRKPPSTKSTPSRKLGTIGGLSSSPRGKPHSQPSTPSKHQTTELNDSDATASASPSPPADVAAESASSPPPLQAAPSTVQEPETEEQIAARRREELKRTINTDTGAKKKRRF